MVKYAVPEITYRRNGDTVIKTVRYRDRDGKIRVKTTFIHPR